MQRLRVAVVVWAVAVSACSGDPTVELFVEIETDLQPGVDFQRVEVVVQAESNLAVHLAATSTSYANPVRVADFSGLAPNSARRLAVTMFGVDITRIVEVDNSTTAAITVRFSADCAGIACPTGRSCLDAACVALGCATGREEACTSSPPGDAGDAGDTARDSGDAGDAARDSGGDSSADSSVDGGLVPGAVICDPGDTGMTLFFVASVFDMGRASPTGDPMVVPGVDVDGIVSDGSDAAGCLHPDFVSPPPDNEAGVDNQLGPILSAVGSSLDISGSIAEGILSGSFLILFEIQHLDDMIDDECVTLTLYSGAPSSTTGLDGDGDGSLDPEQTFNLLPESFDARGEPLARTQGRIRGGRLHAGLLDVVLDLPIGAGTRMNIQNASIRLNLIGDTITSGIIGGSALVEDTVAAIIAIDPAAIPEPLARSVLNAQADIADADFTCSSVSVGFVFEGVAAVQGVRVP